MKKLLLILSIATIATLNATNIDDVHAKCTGHYEMGMNALASEAEWLDIAEVGIGAGSAMAKFMATKARKVFLYHRKNLDKCLAEPLAMIITIDGENADIEEFRKDA